MRGLRKMFHRWVLDSLVTNPPPIIIVLVCVFASVFSIGFLFAHWIDELTFTSYKMYDIMSDNIGGYPVLNIMNNLLPVDIVYTWVNGSDPYVTENIMKLSNFGKSNCISHNCFQSSYYAAEILNDKHAKVISSLPELVKILAVEKNNVSKQFALLYKSDEAKSEEFLARLKSYLNNSITLQQAFWSTDLGNCWSVAWGKSLIFRINPTKDIKFEISKVSSPKNFNNFLKYCSVKDFFTTIIVECAKESLTQELYNDFKDYSSKQKSNLSQVWKAHLILYSDSTNKDLDINRFEDNEELRYSLRSVEKYASWIRRIFLVTNGQIPYWLNLDHPKLSIITHDQIFPDLSHLPTFSSPAIESHIHRIPDLSEHFLYVNDDVMLGDFIWPDDFYIPSMGYKVYLSWSLPECSMGCPGEWISDGFCDRTCNTSECGYDGGDCFAQKSQIEKDESYFIGSEEDLFERTSESCSSACSDSWLADCYCDAACNYLSCGFDAGDCGLEIIKENLLELSFDINKEETAITIPEGVLSAWMDLGPLLEKEKNSSFIGTYSQSKVLHFVTANIPLKALVLVFKPNASGSSHVEFGLVHQDKKVYTHKVNIHLKFNQNTTDQKAPVFTKSSKFPHTFSSPLKVAFPQILNLTYGFNKDDSLFLNHSYSSFTKDSNILMESLHLKYAKGLLTEKGLKLKKLAIMRNYNKNYVSKGEHYSASKFVNQSSEFISKRKLLAFDWKTYKDPGISSSNEFKFERRNLDSFGESLLYVNQLYNAEYGFQARRVLAHMPHLINKGIIQEMQKKFKSQFDLTSSHKVRQANDMQFAFSYFYYLMSEQKLKSFGEIFDLFDTDQSGTWADREIRTFLTKTGNIPLHYESFLEIHNEIKNCSKMFDLDPVPTPPYERYSDSDVPTVTRELIKKCKGPVLSSRLKKLEKFEKFKYSIVSDSAVHFKMIKSNISNVIHHLDDVRKNTKKFICLNQDLDPQSTNNEMVRALLQDTYEALFPIPSAFELPPNYRNRFGYIWQLNEWKRWKNFIRSLIYAFLSCFIFLILSTLFSHEIEAMRKRWCKRRRRKDIKALSCV